MEKIFKACLTAVLHLCIILGHHTILSSSSSSTLNGTSNAIIDHDDSYHQEEHHEHPHHYTDQWAVHLEGGHEVANQLADKHGFINTGQILPDYYHFVHRKVAKRSIEPCPEYHEALSAEPEVRWHAQQVVKRRTKRDFLQLNGNGGRPPFTPSSSSAGSNRNLHSRSQRNQITFNDPRWPLMWYLNRGAGLDMNVQEAWAEGITGKGIVVTILDDGLEKDHPDIIQNYDPLASFDVNSLDNDPMPTYDLTDSNRHGTRCAGEVAAEANNSLCAVGIAYEASVGGIRMLDGDVTDAVEARSLSHMPQHIDIFSASWGPDDDGKTVDGPGELATRAFLEGITKGRQGKGSIFVWASGNGGRDHDNCNCDGYTNSIWTLSISSATENGLVPWYSEACSSTLATTYSSGGNGEKQIVTIDLHHSCTSSHTGTSASAPLAAGICALALQANTNLTWRDMQHIVVRTARPANLIAPDWLTNGVGRNVSHSFGYGLMDAGAMVKLAKRWKTVPEQNKCEVRAPYSDKNIPAKSKVTLDLKVTECPGVNLLEHVQAKVTLTSGRRGDLQIYLVSPQGTRSVLLAHRRHDLNRSGFTDWPFMSVHTWGESPIGKWTLEIHNEGRFADHKNGRTVLKKWSLLLYGTEEDINANISLSSDDNKRSPKGESVPEDRLSSTLPPTELTTNKNFNTQEASKSLPERNNTQLEVGVPTIARKPARQRFRGKTVQKKTQKGVSNSETNNESSTCNGTCSNRTSLTGTIGDKSTEPPTTTISTRLTTIVHSISSSSTPSNISSNTPASSTRWSTIFPRTYPPTFAPTTAVTNATGKLQTWTLVAHGIKTNPNDDYVDKSGTDSTLNKSHSAMEFDGSDNKIVLEPSQVQRNQQISVHSIPNVSVDGDSVHRASPSRAASLQYPGCLKFSMSMVSPGMCVVCEPELYLQDFKCVASCSYNFYPDHNPSTGAKICLPCHYTCLTCFGGEETQCLSCHDDSTLRTTHRTELSYEGGGGSKGRRRHDTVQTTYKESHCYPTELLSTIDGNDMWYKALLMGVIVNVTIVVFLIFYIWLQKQRDRRHDVTGEFSRDSGSGNDDGGSDRDPAALGSSWLSLNRKAYSRVAPQDNDLGDDLENDVFTPLKHQTSQVVSREENVNISNGSGTHNLGVDFKIAIPLIKTSTSKAMGSNNNINPRKFAQSEKERLRLSIPLQQITGKRTDLISPS